MSFISFSVNPPLDLILYLTKSSEQSCLVGSVVTPFHGWGNRLRNRMVCPRSPALHCDLHTTLPCIQLLGLVNRLKYIPCPKCSQAGRKRQDLKPRRNEALSQGPLVPSLFLSGSDQTSTSCRKTLRASWAHSGLFLFAWLNEFMSLLCSSFPMAGASQGPFLGCSIPNWKMVSKDSFNYGNSGILFFFFF